MTLAAKRPVAYGNITELPLRLSFTRLPRPMKTLLRLLPLASAFTLTAFSAERDAATDELPPLFVPLAERRAATAAAATLERSKLAHPLSPLLRQRLQEKISLLAAPSAPTIAAPKSDAVMMDRLVVEAARLPKWTPRRDEPPLWRALKTGVLYEKVFPDGRSVEVFFDLNPFTSGGIQPRQSTRFGLGVSLKW